MDFDELKALRLYLIDITSRHVDSLTCYHDERSNGFRHRHDDTRQGHFSMASTATCVSSLFAARKWEQGRWAARAAVLAQQLLDSDWESAALPVDNPFTVAFIIEAVSQLDTAGTSKDSHRRRTRIQHGVDILRDSIRSGPASIQNYPPTAYLTQLVVRVLRRRGALPARSARIVAAWAWKEIGTQLALLTASSPTADVFQLAYAVILASSLTQADAATPDETATLNSALDRLFASQTPAGLWPRSRPLFHYPGVGSAYCFEYEMLAQLLGEVGLVDKLLKHLQHLRKTADALRDSAFHVGTNGLAWSSGHHPQLAGPESWSTASVYHFTHALDRLVAEAIRRSIFTHLDTVYYVPKTPRHDAKDFAPRFLDCDINIEGHNESLKQVIFQRFVQPVAREAWKIESGGSLSASTAMSAIFFGPPGTSKTELAKQIADFLQWPQLTVDPSHFLRKGMDQLQTEADKVFDMLAVVERVVVLLDEIDEMVRAREQAPEVLSRFLTTSMLPKLAKINRSRKIVFLVATNHIDRFDFAISRPGRFDMILQVMPPTTTEKLKRWRDIRKLLAGFGVSLNKKLRNQLADLTYDEFATLAARLTAAKSKREGQRALEAARVSCTLNADVPSEKKKWRDLYEGQEARIRLI
jgi:hypothetical protein